MPIYEYHCAACDERFETIQKFSDPPLEACPNCEASAPTKLVSASAFHLKGSGWYATDYKSGSNNSDSSKPTKSASDDPAPSTKKDDTSTSSSAKTTDTSSASKDD